MNNLLRVASELDKCGQYELSDKLFLIAQNQNNFFSGVKNLVRPITNLLPPSVNPIELAKTGVQMGENLVNKAVQTFNPSSQGKKQVSQPMARAGLSFNIGDLFKDAPVELVKMLYDYGIEKIETHDGIQGFINYVTTNYGPKYDDFLSRLRRPSLRNDKRMPPKFNKDGSLKLYTMGNNQAFENFLKSTTKLTPNAKDALRGLMQSTGKNLQNISKSLEGFAGSPQAALIEPAIEIAFNEFGKYLENPQAYQSSMSINTKELQKSLNPYKAWQELILEYYAKQKTPQAVLAAFQKDNPTISIQVPNFANGQLFNQPLSMGNQTSKPFNQLDQKTKDNIIFMINNKGALPPTASDTPNMTYNELQKSRMQQ
jgi:hypothetical protein